MYKGIGFNNLHENTVIFMNSLRKESFTNKKKRIQKVVSLLRRYRPSVKTALNHKNPLQLLIATILSAQCTDKRVNEVTKILFKKYKTVDAFSKVPIRKLEQDIHSTGFFRSKAKNIKSACQKIKEEFHGKVPENLKDLVSLPGVGRKTAHVVMGTAFNIPSGVVVDTHVTRLSNRLDFANSKDAVQIEKNLAELLPQSDWIYFSHALIWHGREVCKARRPQCRTCFLEELCPRRGVDSD